MTSNSPTEPVIENPLENAVATEVTPAKEPENLPEATAVPVEKVTAAQPESIQVNASLVSDGFTEGNADVTKTANAYNLVNVFLEAVIKIFRIFGSDPKNPEGRPIYLNMGGKQLVQLVGDTNNTVDVIGINGAEGEQSIQSIANNVKSDTGQVALAINIGRGTQIFQNSEIGAKLQSGNSVISSIDGSPVISTAANINSEPGKFLSAQQPNAIEAVIAR